MSARSFFVVALTDAETYARVTGLVEGRGFVQHGEHGPGGLYPRAMGRRIAAALTAAGIGHLITGANTVNQGLRNLGLSRS